MTSKLIRKEILVVCLLFVATTVAVAKYSYDVTYIRHLDSTFLFEGLDSIRSSGIPLSGTVNSIAEMLRLFRTPAEMYCASPLQQVNEPYLILNNHAYLLMYLLALPTYLISAELMWALLNAVAHLVVLFLPYVYLRRQGVPVLKSLAFVLCVTVYAPWSVSPLGDYYMDRVYMLFMTPLLFAIHLAVSGHSPSGRQIALALLLSVCAALCTERAAIMVICTLCFFAVFYYGELRNKRVLAAMCATAVVLMAYLWAYFEFLYDGLPGAGNLLTNGIFSLEAMRQHIDSPAGATFLLVNLLPLGVLAMFSGPRYLLLAMGALAPNLFYRIGGAELNGWQMHYHVMYVPVIVFTACIGYERLMRLTAVNRVLSAIASLSVAAGAFALAMYMNPFSVFESAERFFAVHWGLPGRLWEHYTHEVTIEKATADVFRSIAGAIPTGTTVSTMETAMAALYRGRRLAYFPLGLSTSDYLVVAGTASDGKLATLGGWVTYLDPQGDATVKQCLIARIDQLGYRVVKDFGDSNYVILRKTSASH